MTNPKLATILALSMAIVGVGLFLELTGGRPPRGGFVAVVGALGGLIGAELASQAGRLRRLEDR